MKRQTSLTEFLPTAKQRKTNDDDDDNEIKVGGPLMIGNNNEDKDKTIIIDPADDIATGDDDKKTLSDLGSAETIEVNPEDNTGDSTDATPKPTEATTNTDEATPNPTEATTNTDEATTNTDGETPKPTEATTNTDGETPNPDDNTELTVKLPSKEVYEILQKYKSEDQKRTLKGLIETIKSINIKTNNYYGNTGLGFSGLKYFFKLVSEDWRRHFFGVLLDKILDAALRLPEFYEKEGPLPIIPANTQGKVKLSQSYAASVVANMFFCTFEKEESLDYLLEPNLQLIYFSDSYINKLSFIIHYFERVLLPQEPRKDTFIVYERRNEAKPPDWSTSSKHLCAIEFTDNVIEDAGTDFLKVDFANRCLGGGVMSHGMVQEEIMFLEAPELLPVRLCFPPLLHNEAAILMGAERYSCHVGYGYSTEISGDYVDTTEVGADNIRKSTIVAIDAVHYRSFLQQFPQSMIDRELFKAYV